MRSLLAGAAGRVALLAAYVAISAAKPSERYLTQYLATVKGFDNHTTNTLIYPVWTYASVVCNALSPVVFALCGRGGGGSAAPEQRARALARRIRVYKVGVVIEALAFLGTRVLLLWGTSLAAMQAAQALFALASSAAVATAALAFAYVDADAWQRGQAGASAGAYQAAASCVAGAALLGKVAGAAAAQADVLAQPPLGDLTALTRASLATVAVSLLIALALPCPRPQPPHSAEALLADGEPREARNGGARPVLRMYAGRTALAWRPLGWSAVWICITAGRDQIENYNQNVWVDDARAAGGAAAASRWNGGVAAAALLLGAVAAMLPAARPPACRLFHCCVRHDVRLVKGGGAEARAGSWAAATAVGAAALLAGAAATAVGLLPSLAVGYTGYAILQGGAVFALAVTQSRVAECVGAVAQGRFGVVGALNALLASAVAAAAQAIIGSQHLATGPQVAIYGALIGATGVALLAAAAGDCWGRRTRALHASLGAVN